MDTEDPVSMEVVLLTTERIGLTLTKKKLAACLPVLQKMLKSQGGTWIDWQRKEIVTGMTAEALSVFINFIQNNKFHDIDAYYSSKIVAQLLNASEKYKIPNLWKELSKNILKSKDAWFHRSTALEMLDVIIRANWSQRRPNTKQMAKRLLEWLARDVGITWKSFDQEKFVLTAEEENMEDGLEETAEPIGNLFPKDHVVILVSHFHKPHEFQVKLHDSVWDLKLRFAEASKHTVDGTRFIHGGRNLEDTKRFVNIEMMMVDIICVVLRWPGRCPTCNPRLRMGLLLLSTCE